MPFSVRLDRHMLDTITRIAVRSNRRTSDVVREALEQYVTSVEPTREVAMTPYDRMAHLIGRVDSGGSRRSEKTGRLFAAQVKAKHHARRTD